MSARALSEERNCSAVMTGPWNIEMLGAREGERQVLARGRRRRTRREES